MLRTSRLLAAVLSLLLSAPNALAATASRSEDDPFALIQDARTVSGASKRPQPLDETPSSVTVISADQIRAHGFQTLGDVLRWVRGVFVTYDRNYTYVGVRGLQRPGDYNNKLLLAIDGHTTNGDVFSDALIGPELGLDLECVERVEVVRGPVSALYGSSAVLGMVNVVTRGTRGEPGVHASLRAGSGDDLRVQADARARSERGIAWAITGSFRSARGADLFFPEFADGPLGGEARGLDSEREANLFMHANWGAHSFALKLNDRMKGVPTASYGTEFGASNLRTWDRRDYFEWNTVASPNRAAELQIRAYWDGARYHGMYPYGPSGAQQLNIDRGDSDALGAEAKIHVAPRAGQTLTAGIEGREIARVRLFNADVGASTPNFDRTFRNEFVPGAYVQHEVRWRHLIRTTLGARVDHYQSFGAVLSPRGDIVWRASPATTLKLLAGSAFRAPSAYEYRYADPSQLANPDLQPERILSYEASIDRLFGPVRTTVSAYQNQIRDLIDQVALDDTGTLLQFRNVDRVTSRGVEAGFEWSPHAGRSLSGDIAWQLSKDSEADNELSNSPRWNAHLLAMYAPEESRWSLGASVRALSPRRTLSGSRTGDAVVADARVGRRVSGEVEVALQARNVFDSRFSDPASSEFLQDKIAQDGRRFFLAVSFRPAVRR